MKKLAISLMLTAIVIMGAVTFSVFRPASSRLVTRSQHAMPFEMTQATSVASPTAFVPTGDAAATVTALALYTVDHCDEATKPLYPIRPLPDSITDVRVAFDDTGTVRTTTFHSAATSEQVQQFYNERLRFAEWELQEEAPERTLFVYMQRGCTPIFVMVIETQPAENGYTAVEVSHLIAAGGPSSWPAYDDQ